MAAGNPGRLGQPAVPDAFYAALVEDSAEDLYDNAPCGYLSCLVDGTIVKVNQTFLTWTGYSREALVQARRFQELLSVGGQIYYETHFGPLLRMQGEAREIAVEVVRADGTRLPALVNSVVTTDADGTPAYIRTAVFDATDRRAYERELLDARRRAEASEAKARVLAHTLQQSLLPPSTPQIPGLDVAAVYRPAGQGAEVGGDFYDVFECASGDWVIVMGDVQGKGAEAAAVTALARYTLRASAIRTAEPSAVLGTLNDVLLRHESEYLCTVVCARVGPPATGGRRMTIATGGHPLPMLLTASATLRPVGTPGTLLGGLDSVDIRDVDVVLEPGDAVVFFTDGVTEARGAGGFLGEEGLERFLHALSGQAAPGIARGLVDAAVAMQNGEPRDDIAVLVARVPRRGEGPAVSGRSVAGASREPQP